MRNNYIVFLKEEEIARLKETGGLKISREEKHHIQKVLRKRLDFQLILSDGRGAFSKAALDSKGLVQGASEWSVLPGNTIEISLMLSPTKRVHLEWAIQKASELGVYCIYLIHSSHQRAHLPRKERLERIIRNACSQSQNFFLPKLQILNIPVTEISINENQFFFWGDFGPNRTIHELNIPKDQIREIIFVNGPEGGWDKQERRFLEEKFPCISLSNNVLRAETAIVCALYHMKLLYH